MNTRARQIYVLLLVMLTGLAYCRVTDNDFIRSFDDGQYVTRNAHVRGGLTVENVFWAFTATHASNWHPLTWLSHMLDWQVYGSNPGGHHLTNLLLHVANTVLLFLLLCRMTGRPTRSLIVAALFAVHPLHVESVAWVAERKDVLSTFFGFLTIAAYLRYLHRPSATRYLLMVLLYGLGLLSKPMLVSLPIALLLLDYWPLRRSSASADAAKALPARRLILEKAPLLLMAAASCVVTLYAQRAGGSVADLETFDLGVRAAVAAVASVAYLINMLWPSGLAFFYPHPGTTLPAWQVAGSALLLALGLLAAIRCARRRPYVTMGLLWYAVTLLPVIGLVQVGLQGMANRYTYLPLIGPFVILAWLVPDLLPSPRLRPILITAASCVILGMLFRTYVEVGYWRDSETLFKRAIAVTKRNTLAHYNLGVELQKQRRWAEAEKQYRQVLRIVPRQHDARLNLALMLMRQSRYKEAEKHYRDLITARYHVAEAYQGLAQSMVGQNRFEDAVLYYKKAIKERPRVARLHLGLGFAYARLKALDKALAEFSRAVTLDPRDAAAHYYLGLIYHAQGKLSPAIKACQEAVDLVPASPQYHDTLARMLYDAGDFRGSWRELQQVERLGGAPNPYLVKALQEMQRRK